MHGTYSRRFRWAVMCQCTNKIFTFKHRYRSRFCPPGHNLLAQIVPHGHNPLADIVPLPPPQLMLGCPGSFFFGVRSYKPRPLFASSQKDKFSTHTPSPSPLPFPPSVPQCYQSTSPPDVLAAAPEYCPLRPSKLHVVRFAAASSY